MPRLRNRLIGMAVILIASGIALCSDSLLVASSHVSWSESEVPDPGSGAVLNAVSCPTSSSCWAVGETATKALALHDQNGSWGLEPLPALAGTAPALTSVSCWSATGCVAVGSSKSGDTIEPLLLVYNGSTWSEEVIPTIGTDDSLTEVVCHARFNCLAIGSSSSSSEMNITLPATPFLLSNAGGMWTILHAAPLAFGPAHASTETYSALSCQNVDLCLIADRYTSSATTLTVLVAGANSWKQLAAPGLSTITAGACESAAQCWFVGAGNTDGSLASDEYVNGYPQYEQLPDPARPPSPTPGPSSPFTSFNMYASSHIQAISCVPDETTCLAVGSCPSQAGTRTLALELSSTGWSPIPAPAAFGAPPCSPQVESIGGPAAAHLPDQHSSLTTASLVSQVPSTSMFTAVSCSAGGTCWAVGTKSWDPSHPLLIAEATVHAPSLFQPEMAAGLVLLLFSGILIGILRRTRTVVS